MSTRLTDYLPAPDEPTDQESPQSEAARQAWRTAKLQAVSESRKTPYDLRSQVCRCNDAKLTDFSKLLFCRLTDMCFESAFKRGDGIAECSKKFLADDFDCSVDSVTRATRALEAAGFLWTKTKWNGAFEITWWFIREWADDKAEYGRHTAGNFGRRQQGVQRNVARNGHGKFMANPNSIRSKFREFLAAQSGNGANGVTVKAKVSPDHGQESALSAPTSQPCPGAIVSLDHGQKSALTGQTNQPGPGAKVSPDRADESALTSGNGQPCPAAEVPGLVNLQTITGETDQDSPKRSTVLNAQRAGGKAPKKASRENLFLLDVGIAMDHWKKGHGKVELKSSGVWWRYAYRADPSLAERVLADTFCQIKEDKIKTNPGAHAVDLWQRWGGPSLAKE